jgi:hypothetical protein
MHLQSMTSPAAPVVSQHWLADVKIVSAALRANYMSCNFQILNHPSALFGYGT